MSTPVDALPEPPASQGKLMSLLYRPPWVGLLAFVIVFVVQALGHTVMIVMEKVWPGPGYVYQSAFAMGAFGAVLLFLGSGSRAPFQTNTAGMMALRIPFAGVSGVTTGDYENDGRTDLFLFSNTGNFIAVAPNKGASSGQRRARSSAAGM